MEKIRLLLIDEKMNSIIVELEPWQFKQLHINKDDIKKHKSRSSLNKSVATFLLENGTI